MAEEQKSATAGAPARNAELLLVKSVKDGIPNRNPADGDARRLFDDGRISLSDVSIKRDARDYVISRYPGGGGNRHVFFREERAENGALLGRGEMARRILAEAGVEGSGEGMEIELPRHAWDVRTFGIVYSVGGENFKQTGPIQLSWGHSLHPVESSDQRGTSSMPQQDSTASRGPAIQQASASSAQEVGEANGNGSEGGVQVAEAEEEVTGFRQGTFWEQITLPFAVFLAPAMMNQTLGQKLGTTTQDIDLLLEGLWRGTQLRHGRGRGFQQPLFMLHVEYEDPHFRIGYLDEGVSLEPSGTEWLSENAPSSISEISLDVGELGKTLSEFSDKIHRIRCWTDPRLTLVGSLPDTTHRNGPGDF